MARQAYKLSNDDFDSCSLKKKLSFKLTQSAKLVLVHGIPAEQAAEIAGLTGKSDPNKVNEAVSQIMESFQDIRKRA